MLSFQPKYIIKKSQKKRAVRILRHHITISKLNRIKNLVIKIRILL